MLMPITGKGSCGEEVNDQTATKIGVAHASCEQWRQCHGESNLRLLITVCTIVFVVSNLILAKSGAPTQIEYFCEFLHLFCGAG
jgi:hypothetical protein